MTGVDVWTCPGHGQGARSVLFDVRDISRPQSGCQVCLGLMSGTYLGSSQARSQGLAWVVSRLKIYILEAAGDANTQECFH